MTVEQARYIAELDPNLPAGSHSVSQADDHLRLTKSALQNSLQGNASDPWDTPLRVGPRALNSLSDTLNLSSFVTLTGTQTISGLKTFSQIIKAIAGIVGDTGLNLVSRWNGLTVLGNTSEDTFLTSPGKNNFGVLYGQSVAHLLHTGNLAEHVVNAIYPIGSVLFDTTATNPSQRFINTTWVRVAQGRYIAGEGTNVDTSGESRTLVNGNLDTSYRHTMTPSEMPSHAHDLESVNDAGGNFTYDGPRHTFVDTGGSFQQGKTKYSGANQPFEKSSPGFVMYTWQRTA